MRARIAVLPGDGIGPEVMTEGIKTLEAVAERFGHQLSFDYGLLGGIAIDETGSALPQATVDICRAADAVLLGAVGGPKWDDPQAKTRPEDGLLGIRKALGLFANLRPVKVFPILASATTLRPEVVADVDLIVVRELTGGLYFGKPKKQWQTSRGRRAVDTLYYTEKEIERVLRVGFELARQRSKTRLGERGRLASVDKANVLESSRLWRQVASELAPQYPDVALEHILVDACAMHLIRQPSRFDVIVTENMFGDILTDEASMLAGSMGMLPSASLRGLGQGRSVGLSLSKPFGLYEPIHGSAPDIAGQDLANPLATILSVAMMLRLSLGLAREAAAVEAAVNQVLDEGYRTRDIMQEGAILVGTREMGQQVAERVRG